MKFGSPPLIRQGSFSNPLPPKDLVHQITSNRSFTFTYICQGSKPLCLCSLVFIELLPTRPRYLSESSWLSFEFAKLLRLHLCQALLALAQWLLGIIALPELSRHQPATSLSCSTGFLGT